MIADCGAYPADASLMPMADRPDVAGIYAIPKVDFRFDARR